MNKFTFLTPNGLKSIKKTVVYLRYAATVSCFLLYSSLDNSNFSTAAVFSNSPVILNNK